MKITLKVGTSSGLLLEQGEAVLERIPINQ